MSREGCLAILTLLITGLYFLLLLIFGMRVVPIGLVGAILAIVTVYSTSMIYAQLKTVPQWNSKLTPIVFLTSSISTGILALLPFLNFFGGISGIMQSVSLASLSATWLAIILYWRFNQNFKPGSSKSVSTLETATGLGSKGRVRLLEAPHSSPNYLTREMVFKIGRKHANKIRGLAFAIGGGVPLLLLIAADTHIIGVILQFGAFLFHLVGILCTRWLFFAEAEHVVSLYYGHKVSS